MIAALDLPGRPAGHFVTVTGISPDGQWVTFNDPLRGAVKMAADEFLATWQNQGARGVVVAREAVPAVPESGLPLFGGLAAGAALAALAALGTNRRGLGGGGRTVRVPVTEYVTQKQRVKKPVTETYREPYTAYRTEYRPVERLVKETYQEPYTAYKTEYRQVEKLVKETYQQPYTAYRTEYRTVARTKTVPRTVTRSATVYEQRSRSWAETVRQGWRWVTQWRSSTWWEPVTRWWTETVWEPVTEWVREAYHVAYTAYRAAERWVKRTVTEAVQVAYTAYRTAERWLTKTVLEPVQVPYTAYRERPRTVEREVEEDVRVPMTSWRTVVVEEPDGPGGTGGKPQPWIAPTATPSPNGIATPRPVTGGAHAPAALPVATPNIPGTPQPVASPQAPQISSGVPPRIYIVNGIGSTAPEGTPDGQTAYLQNRLVSLGHPEGDVRAVDAIYNRDLAGWVSKHVSTNEDLLLLTDLLNRDIGASEVLREHRDGPDGRYTQEILRFIVNDLQASSLLPGQTVLLLGHSGGGAVAANLASLLESDPVMRGHRVEGVVTMGSPVANYDAASRSADRVVNFADEDDPFSHLFMASNESRLLSLHPFLGMFVDPVLRNHSPNVVFEPPLDSPDTDAIGAHNSYFYSCELLYRLAEDFPDVKLNFRSGACTPR